MRTLFSIIWFVCQSLLVFGQNPSEGDLYKVIDKLAFQWRDSFLNKVPVLFRAEFSQSSLQVIKLFRLRAFASDNSLAKRSLINGQVFYDTLRLSIEEKQYLDSCLFIPSTVGHMEKLNECKVRNCILIDSSNSTKYSEDRYTKYEIMKPIFLRNQTIAFAFYQRRDHNVHTEFTILIKLDNEWIIWDRVIVYES
jgi:hypothetical protein